MNTLTRLIGPLLAGADQQIAQALGNAREVRSALRAGHQIARV